MFIKKFNKYFIFICAILFSKNVYAISLPLGFMIKPYIGGSLYLQNWSDNDQLIMGGGFDRFKNLDVHAGVRIHKYLSFEIGYIYLNNKIIIDGVGNDLGLHGSRLDMIFLYPFFDIGGTAIELYINGGITNGKMSIGNLNRGFTNTMPRIGTGLQFKLFGMTSAKIGYEGMYVNWNNIGGSETSLGWIHSLKAGVDIYFL